jgi:DNA-binding NarL/FixJ family response regulator
MCNPRVIGDNLHHHPERTGLPVKRTRVMIVDDHQTVIEGLKNLFETDDDSEVIGEATSGWEAVEMAKDLHPDVVVMDFTLGDIDGIEAASRIRSEHSETDVVMLSVHDGHPYEKRAGDAGVRRWISKAMPADELLREVASIRSQHERPEREGGVG